MGGVNRSKRIIEIVAITFVVAAIAVSCGRGQLTEIDALDIESTPMQRVENMKAYETNDGNMKMRMESALMERFSTSDGGSYELFSGGFNVYAYNTEGLLETKISSKMAKHTMLKQNDTWEAYGDVVIRNYIKGERIETDTLYWNGKDKRIYTDCYVKLTSPQGFMQGYGLESDEMARNAVLLRPFDSYGVVSQDTTTVTYVDSANFIGPLYNRYK